MLTDRCDDHAGAGITDNYVALSSEIPFASNKGEGQRRIGQQSGADGQSREFGPLAR